MSGIVVLSPHLDDAVMSVGGLLFRLARTGTLVRVLTVFAGMKNWVGPASSWDAKRGLASAADAFAVRAAEDDVAASRLGLTTRRLPFLDAGYGVERDPYEIWQAIAPHLANADLVLVPGSPLAHEDHRFVTDLVTGRFDGGAEVGFYAEQPYSSRPRYLPGFLARTTPPGLTSMQLDWTDFRLDRDVREVKAAAVASYAGELYALGWRAHIDALVQRIAPVERVGFPAGTPIPSCLTAPS